METGYTRIRSVDFFQDKIAFLSQDGYLNQFRFKEGVKKLDPTKQQIIMRTHCDGEVWGLDIRNNQAYTTGDDNWLFKWDLEKRVCTNAVELWNKERGNEFDPKKTQMKKKKLTASTMGKTPESKCARAVAYSKKNDHLAVAYLDGKIVFRDGKNTIFSVMRDPDEWCESMKYSPDEKYLAVGSHDNNIYIYEIRQKGYKLLTKLVAHNSYIMAFDWSADGTYIRSNCGAYELLFFEIPTDYESKTKNDPSGASNTKDIEWATQNCKLGWAV